VHGWKKGVLNTGKPQPNCTARGLRGRVLWGKKRSWVVQWFQVKKKKREPEFLHRYKNTVMECRIPGYSPQGNTKKPRRKKRKRIKNCICAVGDQDHSKVRKKGMGDHESKEGKGWYPHNNTGGGGGEVPTTPTG